MKALFKTAILSITFATMPTAASAAVYRANSTDDVDNSESQQACVSEGSGCTLRSALALATQDPDHDAIALDAQSPYEVSGAPLVVGQRTDIWGWGMDSTIVQRKAGTSGRVFTFVSDANSRCGDFTIRNGRESSSFGGGVYVESGGAASFERIKLANNESQLWGGGAYVTGYLDCAWCAVTDNRTSLGITGADGQTAAGGGIYVATGAILNLWSSTVSLNRAARGAGLAGQGQVRVHNSTISGNQAQRTGGGVFVGYGSSYRISFSTVAANLDAVDTSTPRERRGAGIFIETQGVLQLGKSIVLGNKNSSTLEPSDCGAASGTFPISYHENILSSTNVACYWNGPAGQSPKDQIIPTSYYEPFGTPSILGALSNNGGPTMTHMVQPNTIAVDLSAGSLTNGEPFWDCPDYDQRGVLRPRDGNGDGRNRCDVGATEY